MTALPMSPGLLARDGAVALTTAVNTRLWDAKTARVTCTLAYRKPAAIPAPIPGLLAGNYVLLRDYRGEGHSL